VNRHLAKMTLPMIGGMFALSAFNITDTYFVGKLGVDPLAAMSFTFPVVMIVGAIAMGIGMGAGAVISRAIGAGDTDSVRRLTTHSLLLTILVVTVVGLVGLLTIDPLFRAMGATEDLMPMLRDYMSLWYACVCVLFVPMVGNNCIRATGDTVSPAIIMASLAILNVGMDPIFIFGMFGCPEMGIFGAALATVLSRGIGIFLALWILYRRLHMITFERPRLKEVLNSWREVFKIAAPSAMSHLLAPLSAGIVTAIIAGYGNNAVAAAGAGGRIQMFLYMVPVAMGTILVPFVGQNWGAGQTERATDAWAKSSRFNMFYGCGLFLLMLPLAGPASELFTNDPEVISLMKWFLWTVLITNGFQHIGVHSGFIMNAIGYPMTSFALNALRAVLICPLAYLGGFWLDIEGVFMGIAATQVVSGILGWWLLPILFVKAMPAHRVGPEAELDAESGSLAISGAK